MRKFICKQGASNYYMQYKDGMGRALNPPKHPEHSQSIVECRGGHEVGFMSLSYAAECDDLPARVRGAAKGALKRWNPTEPPDSAWLDTVYQHFQHCYSRDGVSFDKPIIFGKFWDNEDLEQGTPPIYHLGYLWVKKFYPDHTPDVQRIGLKPYATV